MQILINKQFIALHSEMNAILYAAKLSASLQQVWLKKVY